MNELLFFVQMIICFGTLLVMNKLFGKVGVFAYIALAVILANIEVSCLVNMFGLPDGSVCLGNVTFASVFLATDILNECYGYKESKKGVAVGIISAVFFVVMTQIDTFYKSATDGFMHETFITYFSVKGAFVWVTASSLIMFCLAHMADVWLFERIKRKTGNKWLWLRNNVSTIVANCTENALFCIFGYYLFPLWFTGTELLPLTNAVIISLTTSLIEIIIGLLDTPFLYIARRWKHKEKTITEV